MKEENRVLTEAWDGSPMWVPESRLEEYRKAQDEIKARNGKMTPGEKRLAALLAKSLKEKR